MAAFTKRVYNDYMDMGHEGEFREMGAKLLWQGCPFIKLQKVIELAESVVTPEAVRDFYADLFKNKIQKLSVQLYSQKWLQVEGVKASNYNGNPFPYYTDDKAYLPNPASTFHGMSKDDL